MQNRQMQSILLSKQTQKNALFHASMVVTYYIKLLGMDADRHYGILMSLLPSSRRDNE